MSPYRETVKATDEHARDRAEHAYDLAKSAIDDVAAVDRRVSGVEERVDRIAREMRICFWVCLCCLVTLLFAVLATVSRLRRDIVSDATAVEADVAERERARRTTLEQDRVLCARACGHSTYVAAECEWDRGGVRECECTCFSHYRGWLYEEDVREQR